MSVNSTGANLLVAKKKKRKRVEDSEEMIDMFNLNLEVYLYFILESFFSLVCIADAEGRVIGSIKLEKASFDSR
jgi:hypothetical protein